MKLEVNIDKKYFLILLGAVLLIGSGFFVYAYNTNNPATFGHSSGEIDVDIDGDGNFDKTLQQAIDDGDFSSGGSGSAMVKTANYVGTGSTQNLDIGFVPNYIVFQRRDTGDFFNIGCGLDGNFYDCKYQGGDSGNALGSGIISVSPFSGGFEGVTLNTVGAHYNADGTRYSYFAAR